MEYWNEIGLYLTLEHIISSIRSIGIADFSKLLFYERLEHPIIEVECSELSHIPNIEKISYRWYLPRESCSYLLSKCLTDIDTSDRMQSEYVFFEDLITIE